MEDFVSMVVSLVQSGDDSLLRTSIYCGFGVDESFGFAIGGSVTI